MTSQATFDEYLRRSRLATETIVASLERTTSFRTFDTYVLKVMWLHELGHVSYPDTDEGDVARGLVVKMVHECRSLLACASSGASLGTLHHARGVLETWACTHYVFAEPKNAAKRAKRWVNFRSVYQYAHRRSLEIELEAGNISQVEFDARCLAPPTATDISPQELQEWEKLYDAKGELASVKSWLHGRSYEQLLEAVDKTMPERLDLAKQYGQSCHATHPSPLATGVLRGLKLCDNDASNHEAAISLAAQALHRVLALLPCQPANTLVADTTAERKAWQADFLAK